jgi:hypothetical protein
MEASPGHVTQVSDSPSFELCVVIILKVGMCSRMENIKPEWNIEELRGVLERGSAGQREASGKKFVLHAVIN